MESPANQEIVPTFDPFPIVRIAHIAADSPEPSWLITSLWGEQAVGFVGGTPKSNKTWLALELAVAVASGTPCLGRFAVTEPGHVLLYTAEDGAADVRRRVAAIATAHAVRLAEPLEPIEEGDGCTGCDASAPRPLDGGILLVLAAVALGRRTWRRC